MIRPDVRTLDGTVGRRRALMSAQTQRQRIPPASTPKAATLVSMLGAEDVSQALESSDMRCWCSTVHPIKVRVAFRTLCKKVLIGANGAIKRVVHDAGRLSVAVAAELSLRVARRPVAFIALGVSAVHSRVVQAGGHDATGAGRRAHSSQAFAVRQVSIRSAVSR